jgi:hypothetical protein
MLSPHFFHHRSRQPRPLPRAVEVNGYIRKIVTTYWMKPIPTRQHDWEAVTDNYEGGDPIGYGETEAEAIFDLIDQLKEAA